MNRPMEWAGIPAAQIAVTLLAQMVLVLVGRLTTTTALAAWLVGVAVATVFGLWLVGSRVRIRFGIDRNVLGAFLRFGIKGYTANTIMLLNYRLDSLILNGLAGAASVGFYSISVAMAEAQWYIANAIGSVMFPHVASNERAESDRITPIVCRNTVFVTLVAAVAMVAMSRFLIATLFGAAMLPALYALWLLLPGIVTASAAKVIASYLSGIGKPTYAMYISSSHLFLTIMLDVTLIPRFGINGAAIASSIVYTSATVFSVWAFVHESHNSVWDTLVVRTEDFIRYRRLAGTTYRRLTSLRAVQS
jgi:O-antigen/teichoic acid export membrane protein